MSLFLLTFFLIYGSVHFYAFMKAKAALAFGTAAGISLILFMLLMVLAPIIVHLLEKAGHESFARVAAYIGYGWLGILFLFFSLSITVDIYRLVIYLAGLILRTDVSAWAPAAMSSFILCLSLAICISIYGYFEARDIRTERLVIRTNKIPLQTGRMKIVQISDVHLGLIVGEERLKLMLEKIKNENPDILVSTGDLVDGQISSHYGLAELLAEIKPPRGKFAITGNHEFYAGLAQAIKFTEKAGFKMIRGEGLTVDGMINVAGVDDPAGKYSGLIRAVSERELLSALPRDKFTLLLKHRPVVDKTAIGSFDLQLSGHSHKGQIFPFSIATRLYYTVDAGLMKLPNNTFMYASRGTGTWGPPIRFLAPPEVTVIELVHDNQKH